MSVKSLEKNIKIGIAWRAELEKESYQIFKTVVEEAGGEPIFLKQVVDYDLQYVDEKISSVGLDANDFLSEENANIVKNNTYHNSNVCEVLEGIDAVIFTGGEDFSPTLVKNTPKWHGIAEEKNYNATRDVNDYLLWSYCIDNDIPAIGICRGMQMLGVVSGAEMIQDIPTFYKENGFIYHDEHRNNISIPEEQRDYVPHDVNITDRDSLIYEAFKADIIEKVPSWHHQAVKNVKGTELKVSASTFASGCEIIEAIERIDKTLILGVQFHPETAILKITKQEENAGIFMDKEHALKLFTWFAEKVKEIEGNKI